MLCIELHLSLALGALKETANGLTLDKQKKIFYIDIHSSNEVLNSSLNKTF